MQSLGRAWGLLVAAVAIAAAAVLLAACSAAGDYPSVLAPPTARTGQPMTQEQVQQETNALTADRSQLSAEAEAAQASARASGMMQPAPPATTGTTPGAGATTKQ